MNAELFSVEHVASLLHLHKKTILRYISEGRLKARKVGRQWRISGHDLSRFVEGTEEPERPSAGSLARQSSIASAVIDVPVASQDEAMHLMNSLTALANGKDRSAGHSTVHLQLMVETMVLRISLWGSVTFIVVMAQAVEQLAGDRP